MRSSRVPLFIASVAVVAAVVAFFVLRDSEDGSAPATTVAETTTASDEPGSEDKPAEDKPDEPEKPEVPKIVIEDGQPVGGVAELEFTVGDAIRFEVVSDVAEEVHMHGYDVSMDVEAGGSVQFDVPATLDGVFEVELEHSVVPIAEITVNPA
jgi:hypothetical protein